MALHGVALSEILLDNVVTVSNEEMMISLKKLRLRVTSMMKTAGKRGL